jgi:hypothetical protein
MTDSPFRSRPFGDAATKLSQLAQSDAESLHSRAEYVAPGRYRSLFETHLETAMMFLNKAIAFDGVTELPVRSTAAESATEQPVRNSVRGTDTPGQTQFLFTPSDTEENESG